jgi:hypothetical protein
MAGATRRPGHHNSTLRASSQGLFKFCPAGSALEPTAVGKQARAGPLRRRFDVRPLRLARRFRLLLGRVADPLELRAPLLDDAVVDSYPRLILDLSAVTLVDSSAFGAIRQTQYRFGGQGGRWHSSRPTAAARRGARTSADGSVEALAVSCAPC